MKKCDTLGCHATAVAKSTLTGNHYCMDCSLKAYRHAGQASLTTIPGMRFPWDMEPDTLCNTCGLYFSSTVLARTEECPHCRNEDLTRPRVPKEHALPDQWAKQKVKYEEGQHD